MCRVQRRDATGVPLAHATTHPLAALRLAGIAAAACAGDRAVSPLGGGLSGDGGAVRVGGMAEGIAHLNS